MQTCKSGEKNPQKELHVVNSKIPINDPSHHDTKNVLPNYNGIHYQIPM